MASECKGCAAYSGVFCQVGIIPHIKNTDGCPCRKCLVKSMCRSEICEKYTRYRNLSRSKRCFHEVMHDFSIKHFWRYS